MSDATNAVFGYDSSLASRFKAGDVGTLIELVNISSTQTLSGKTLTSPVLNTSVSGTAVLDEDNMASDSATQIATQQSIKAYVDQAETDANSFATSAVGTHAALTSSHGVTGDIVGTGGSQTLASKILTSPVLNTGVSGTAVLDQDDMSSNSDTQLATQQSIKAYVDTTRSNVRAVEGNVAVSSDVTLTDRRLHFVDASAARSLELPAAAATLFLIVKDATGQADTNNITLTTPGAETIEGASTYVIEANYASVNVVSDGTNYFVV
jgi:hypothetical protein